MQRRTSKKVQRDRSFNEEKVKKCVARLDSAVEDFTPDPSISCAQPPHLGRRIVHNIQQNIYLDQSLKQLQAKADNVHALLDERLPEAPPAVATPPRGRIPGNTNVIHGRDDVVSTDCRSGQHNTEAPASLYPRTRWDG
ncbi:hypothetical protein DXG03_005822 [Asterophora parasitica]|uniref:Uncharacterized protein n=1 Tax=Asterophora parasitica TaxID=117018 RepID=A0A9P7GE63_9AGAR|nr:hypothetical protein DXG03_005822 [Asterophora parasitica]